MSVTNRKMFNRGARNKVRQMGGIMASSEPLMQEVAKFNQGMMVRANQAPLVGPVNPPYRPTSMFEKGYTGPMFLEDMRKKFGNIGIPSMINPDTGGVRAIEYVRDKTLEDLDIGPMEDAESGVFTRSGKILDNNPALKTFLTTGSTSGYDRYGDIFKDIMTDGVQTLGAGVIDVLFDKNLQFIPDRNQPTDKALVEFMSGDRDKIPADMQDSEQMLKFIAGSSLPNEKKKNLAKQLPLTDASAFRRREEKTAIAGGAPDPAQTGTTDADEIQKALDAAQLKEERGPGGAEEQRANLTGARRTDNLSADPEAIVDQLKGTDGFDRPQTLGVTADQGVEAKLSNESKKVLGGEGNIDTVKDQVTESFKTGVGVKGAIKQFMDEFVSNAPEYKGMDKGLAIAKIGFAMAAGESPNALTNIAKALSDGADMFLKDDEQRRSFQRQVELAGLQYGVSETSKIRAEGRAQARQDRTLKYFVAGENMTFDGVKYGKDDIVAVPEGYIRQKGVPPGLTTENLVKGAKTTQAQIEKLLLEAKEKKRMTDKDYRENRKIISEAALSFEKSRNLTTLLDGQIFNVVEGRVTGATNFARDLVNKAANTIGLTMNESYQTLEEYDTDMRNVANQLIKDLLGEGSKNISNVDRQLASEIVGLFTTGASGVLGGYIYRDDDVLLQRLQRIRGTLQKTQRDSLADMSDILQLSVGRTFMSDAPVTYGRVTKDALAQIRGGQRTYDPTTGTVKVTGTQDEVIRLTDLLTDGLPDEKKISGLFGDL